MKIDYHRELLLCLLNQGYVEVACGIIWEDTIRELQFQIAITHLKDAGLI